MDKNKEVNKLFISPQNKPFGYIYNVRVLYNLGERLTNFLEEHSIYTCMYKGEQTFELCEALSCEAAVFCVHLL